MDAKSSISQFCKNYSRNINSPCATTRVLQPKCVLWLQESIETYDFSVITSGIVLPLPYTHQVVVRPPLNILLGGDKIATVLTTSSLLGTISWLLVMFGHSSTRKACQTVLVLLVLLVPQHGGNVVYRLYLCQATLKYNSSFSVKKMSLESSQILERLSMITFV